MQREAPRPGPPPPAKLPNSMCSSSSSSEMSWRPNSVCAYVPMLGTPAAPTQVSCMTVMAVALEAQGSSDGVARNCRGC